MEKVLSVLIPVYNEESFVEKSILNVLGQNLNGWTKDIIVVNDGSTDGSWKIIKKLKKTYPEISILSLDKNMGKGAAIKKAIEKSKGDVCIIQDADLEYDTLDYLQILKEFDSGNDVVYGSRDLGRKMYHSMHAAKKFYLGGLLLTKMLNLFFSANITDQPTCYKSWRKKYNSEILNKCKTNGFEFEIELSHLFAVSGKIKEVPIHYFPRSVEHGKKINFGDFLKSVKVVLILYIQDKLRL